VRKVSVEAPRLPCFLVEWYRCELIAEPLGDIAARVEEAAGAMCEGDTPVKLLMMLAVPTDEVLFAIFAAGCAHAVSEVCRRAGFPAERLTNVVDARIAG
jgi:hypothetical protein